MVSIKVPDSVERPLESERRRQPDGVLGLVGRARRGPQAERVVCSALRGGRAGRSQRCVAGCRVLGGLDNLGVQMRVKISLPASNQIAARWRSEGTGLG